MRNAIQLLIPMLFLAAPAQAQWTIDGVGVSTAPGDQAIPAITYDDAGGWFVTWADHRGADWDIYAQRLNAGGATQWAVTGVSICNVAQDQSDVQIVSDDAGGAIIVWSDRRSGAQDIYAQRIKPNGTPWWTANGVAICTAANNQWYPRVVPDGSGGAIITWVDFRSGTLNSDIYSQRINAAGVVQWTANGVAIGDQTITQFPPAIATDDNGGAIITWHIEPIPGSGDIYAQRINSAGAVQWGANGVAVGTDPSDQFYPVIVSDGSSGAIIVWHGGGAEWDLYAQRVNSAGALQWNPAGVAICTAAGAQASESQPGIIPDGFGGAIITWDDLRTGGFDVYAQRISSGGGVAWTGDGVVVSAAADAQQSPTIVQDAYGGAIISWFDNRGFGTFDIYAQRMSVAGAPQWTADGIPVCTAAGDQYSPVLLANAGGAVVAWDDGRSGRDVYAQRIQSDGKAVSFTVNSTAEAYATGTLWEAIAQANAILGPQVIRFDIPGAGPHVINVLTFGLPPITDALTIDGFTQPDASPNTNPFGSASNAQIKIQISGSSFLSGIDFQALGTLRGVAISGFNPASIVVQAFGVVIEGNYIGTDASGLNAGPHAQVYGVQILGINGRVGGTTPAARNVICNSLQAGVGLDGAVGAQVFGNYIGAKADAASVLSNWEGVRILNEATGSRVGSSVLATIVDPAERNLIMGNNYFGVVVEGASTEGNLIVGNTIGPNVFGSIDLGADGFDTNDPGDVDSGPNQRQNYPELTSAVGSHINGNMTGAPSQQLFLHFYWSPFCCGLAMQFVGGAIITLDGSGAASFAASPPGTIPPGAWVNATATDVFGNTSELSGPIFYMNTSSGSSQVATLTSSNGDVYGTATFANVTSAGNTYTENPYTPPVPVSGYSIGNPNDPQIYFNITTNAAYTGGVDICLNYNENSIPGPEANLVLLHYDGSNWVDVTTSRDPANNKVCGHVTSLSPFVIGAVTPTGIDTPVPTSFALHGNVPNPFNPITTITYDIPQGGADVSIVIYDVAGRLVRDLVHEHRPAGTWSVQWNGEGDRGQRVASGVYFYRMRAGNFVDTKKMVLLK